MGSEEKNSNTVYEKLSKVLLEVGNVPKNGYNSFHQYHYVQESDLVDTIRPLLAKHGLAIAFGCKSVTRHGPFDISKGGQTWLTQAECVVRVGDIDGNEIVETIFGEAMDPADKGLYKAMTGAMKYWLNKTFLVGTGNDADPDAGQRPQTKSGSSIGPPTEEQKTELERLLLYDLDEDARDIIQTALKKHSDPKVIDNIIARGKELVKNLKPSGDGKAPLFNQEEDGGLNSGGLNSDDIPF